MLKVAEYCATLEKYEKAIKIYETVEIGSDGAGEDLSSDGDYETVFFVNQKITPKTLVRPPRTLKSSCR